MRTNISIEKTLADVVYLFVLFFFRIGWEGRETGSNSGFFNSFLVKKLAYLHKKLFNHFPRFEFYWENRLSAVGYTFASVPSILGSLPFGERGYNESVNHYKLTII
jgi:hypothetical protein